MKGLYNIKTATALFFLFSLIFSAFSGGNGEQEPVKIGVAGPHTGDLAPYGIPTLRATELVVEEINEQGGILGGRPVELVVGDEQCAPDQAVNIAARMIESDVVGVIGHICSGATIAALDVYRFEGVPIISPSATNPGISLSGDNPIFFRTISHDEVQSRLQVEFLGTLGVRKLAILHDKGDYGKGLAELVQVAAIDDGLEVVLFEGITPGAPDYSAIVLKIVASDPEVVVFGGYHPEASRILGQMKTQGLDALFFSGDSIRDAAFVNVAKADAEGVYATGPIDSSDEPSGRRAYERHVEKFNEEPGNFYQSGYSAAQALIAAIDAAGTDKAAVVEVLKSKSFQTSLGDISFDSSGDIVGAGFGVFQIRNGDFVRVY